MDAANRRTRARAIVGSTLVAALVIAGAALSAPAAGAADLDNAKVPSGPDARAGEGSFDDLDPEVVEKMRHQEKLYPAVALLTDAAQALPKSGYAEIAFEGDGVTSQPLPGDVGELVDYLNDLPTRSGHDSSGSTTDRLVPGCALMGRPAYRIVLAYTNRSAVIINVDPNCATVARGGVVRTLSTLAGLLAFWPSPTPS